MPDATSEITAGQRFAFGENWARFLELVDGQRIGTAEESLRERLGDLTGQSFLDVGCGSGLFSLAARNLGAHVVSFDYDPQSVACAIELRRRYRRDDDDWRIEQGSALDRGYLHSLGQFDVLYSWGVLHHTGDMWSALANIAELVAPNGRLFISIYNDQGRVSDLWKVIKRRYVRTGPVGRAMLLGVVGSFLEVRSQMVALARGRSATPRRGMDRVRDIVDWVGGWPFEVARPDQIQRFYESWGFDVLYVSTVGRRMGNNQFLLHRR